MEERIELIVQYVGDLARVQREMGFPAVMLLGGYAVVRIEPERIEELKSYPEIVYVELPTRLFYEVNNGKAVSCIGEVQAPSFLFPEAEASPETVGLSETVRLHETVGLSETVRLQETVRSPETVGLQETLRESGAPPEMPDSEIPSGRSALSGDMSANLALTGRGVLVAVIDSGIDYFHPDFRNGDGSSRIALLWDQSVRAGEGGLGIPLMASRNSAIFTRKRILILRWRQKTGRRRGGWFRAWMSPVTELMWLGSLPETGVGAEADIGAWRTRAI